jgi:hypothetical protein
MSSNLGTPLSQARGVELANLILISYLKNKIFLERLIEGKDEIPNLLESELHCNSDSEFDETAPNHEVCQKYKILTWLWHTDRPLGFFKQLRTLPFGFIAENQAAKEIFIVFRGTITSDEWGRNATFRLKSEFSEGDKLGLVHEGFHSIFSSDYYDRIRSGKGLVTRLARRLHLYETPPIERRASIQEAILKTIVNNDWHKRGYSIYVTGHSLGGALAMLAGQFLLSFDREGYQDILSICTFAAPRVGNEGFAAWFEEVDVVRYVNTEDVVPTVPPSTSKLLGEDMDEFHVQKIRAERQRGFRNINTTFASTKGGVGSPAEEGGVEEPTLRAFVHVGHVRSFTKNKGSVSYNHNMAETYRQGISVAE